MFPGELSISDFTYTLPEDRIAIHPLAQRDASKLLVYKQTTIGDYHFSDIPTILPPQSLVVFNNSRVVPARLFFQNENGAHIEVFCMAPQEGTVTAALAQTHSAEWKCLVGNLKKWKQPQLVLRDEKHELTVTKIEDQGGTQRVRFAWSPGTDTFAQVLEWAGHMPLPPYLKREDSVEDQTRYQTVYAGPNGSVAAPTAGLHFTEALMDKMKQDLFAFASVTLHVSAGTFLPVKSEKMADHPMHGEWCSISAETVNALKSNAFVTAVGTTSLRTVETFYWLGVKLMQQPAIAPQQLTITQWEPYQMYPQQREKVLDALLQYMQHQQLHELHCYTTILIAPPYKLKLANALITNFHQPQSTLLLLVAAVAGEKWREIYAHALNNSYRFLSYGDSSVIFVEDWQNSGVFYYIWVKHFPWKNSTYSF